MHVQRCPSSCTTRGHLRWTHLRVAALGARLLFGAEDAFGNALGDGSGWRRLTSLSSGGWNALAERMIRYLIDVLYSATDSARPVPCSW